ncbi:type I-D CRISPR-associated protein Cas7/Csc2 [Sulfolobus sp. E5-1-F]|uniref:type I-D CRISPR-associated protein Cas7/Csc2 n=1 Tax=Saccharolobus sp. E5-1-F TaxID=2663019 RepID=UPI0012974FF8|nr:type I-D CRISPR-associated protein Cas7/Csc2 [Sulfolobus sp. E5-1-F]QGA53942.1 type I-D CRISPR-associated protein Cas7/Csc2 [Sulfolobus sp. E5-1-F]
MKAEEAFKSIFGVEVEKVKQYFSDLSKEDPKSVVPQGKVINVYLVIRANNELLIRHEGGEDISLGTFENEKYPIILYDKFQSAYRRKELELLRANYIAKKVEVNKIRGKDDDWFCALRPTAAVKKQEERMGGLCGECPDCMTFGFAVREGGNYNVKSRIEGDLLISTTPESKSVVVRTFNAVDDIKKTTLIGGEEEGAGRTGALFRYSLVKEGTIFVGKIAMKDIGLNDFLVKIATLSTISKLGGRTTDFGNVKVFIPAIMFSTYEISSSYDIFTKVKGKENVEDLIQIINRHLEDIKKGVLVTSKDFSENIQKILFDQNGMLDSDIVLKAWEEAKNFKLSIESSTRSKK